jgi:hypothetical protein
VQIRSIYLEWAEEHPDKLHAPAFMCVIGALSEAAPKKLQGSCSPQGWPFVRLELACVDLLLK